VARLGILLYTHIPVYRLACLYMPIKLCPLACNIVIGSGGSRIGGNASRPAMTFPVKVFSKVLCNIASLGRVRAVGHGIYQTYTAFPYYCYYYYYYYYHDDDGYRIPPLPPPLPLHSPPPSEKPSAASDDTILNNILYYYY